MTNHDDIARRAYELYEACGRQDGHDYDDWLQAERELQALSADQRQSAAKEGSTSSASSTPSGRMRRKERAVTPATL